jgi:hypothetical protein
MARKKVAQQEQPKPAHPVDWIHDRLVRPGGKRAMMAR